MYLLRQAEKEILRLANHFPAVAIVGPRQVGKTSIAKELSRQWSRPVVYLDLENPSDLNKMADPLLFLEPLQESTVILDEVQRVPHLFPILRGLIDKHRVAGRFILLGSASPDLIRDASETLAGRIAYFELPTLAFSEVQSIINYQQHWFRGGFPDSLLAQDDALSLDWRDNFIKTYLERDLPMLGLSANPMMTRRMWTMLAHWNGNLINYDAIGRSLGISSPTVKRYIDFFEASYLVRRIEPWFVNISKRLVRSPKVFIRDTGILHTLLALNNFEQLQGHPQLGSSWEAYIIQELMNRLPPRHELYFYRTQDGTEADAVIVKGGVPDILVEIKYSSSPSITKSMQISAKDLATRRNVIVTPTTENYPMRDGFEVMSFRDLDSLFS